MERQETIVIKVGSSSVTNHEFGLDYSVINSIAKQSAELFSKGFGVVIVSSGAVAAGRMLMKNDIADMSLIGKQEAAIFGQPKLISAWVGAFEQSGILSGQLLLTEDNLKSDHRPLLQSLKIGIPVINANDPVNDYELRQYLVSADNDNLGGFVAQIVKASKYIIMTDVDGVKDKDDNVIESVRSLNDLRRIKLTAKSEKGTGGMRSKIKAGLRVSKSGCEVWIVNARDSEAILKCVSGIPVGTRFCRT